MMNKKEILIIAAVFIVIFLILFLFPNSTSEYIKAGNLYINEIMASNKKTIRDNYGEYSDYIEIYNGTNHMINLKGYYLSDSEFETNKWQFPNIDIKSKEFLLVYASKRDECNLETRVCHTNFKLSSTGETLTLSDKSGNIISKFTYPATENDTSYGYYNGKYMLSAKATPGKKNEKIEIKRSNNNYNIEITEYMTHNKRYHYDKYGNYYDWIEIHNLDKQSINLENAYITDDETNLKKYKIPNTIIDKDGYLIIYLAGDSNNYEDGIYANFGLSDEDTYIILTNGSKIIDRVSIVKLKDNISYGKVDDKWQYFTSPTPGKANTTASFDQIGGNNGST